MRKFFPVIFLLSSPQRREEKAFFSFSICLHLVEEIISKSEKSAFAFCTARQCRGKFVDARSLESEGEGETSWGSFVVSIRAPSNMI
jgi:hypothetical protein